MKTSFGMATALLVVLSCASTAQTTQQTTQTKVGVGRDGVQVTRTRTDTMTPPRDRGRYDRRPMRYRRGREGQDEIRVILDGDPIHFEGQGPIMEGDHVLVPLRGVFQKMGADLVWDRANHKVIATRGGRTVEVPLGGGPARVDGRRIGLDQPAVVMNGRALVPLRFLSESFGAQVDWNAAEETVRLHS